MGGRYERTDFSGYTDGWRDLANALDDVALTIERQDADFRGLWQGQSAAEHAAMIASLVDGVRRVGRRGRGVRRQGDGRTRPD